MKNIILHKRDLENRQLLLTWQHDFLRQLLLGELGNMPAFSGKQASRFFLPAALDHHPRRDDIRYYDGEKGIETDRRSNSPWLVIYNGRSVVDYDPAWLRTLLGKDNASVLTVMIDPDLKAYQERARITTDGRLAGFYRNYSDLARRAPVPQDWPHLVLIPRQRLAQMPQIPLDFQHFLHETGPENMRHLRIAGDMLDLAKETDVLRLFNRSIDTHYGNSHQIRPLARDHECDINPSVRVYGTVFVGRRVRIADHAVLIGPAFFGDHVQIDAGAVVKNAIIHEGLSVSRETIVNERLITEQSDLDTDCRAETPESGRQGILFALPDIRSRFRSWPWYSYAGALKRFFDFLFAATVLFCFVPFFIIIALLIKITDPGPIFFRHKRQGRYGREFGCLKFRTMVVGADSMQQMLKRISQVDGPQFKIEDDPRVSAIGRFLRDTNLDEIPQFINVLRGEMSVIGPRPSPAKENTLCPYWRDIRLSVRPGITGQWQIYRSRSDGRDFQEWIHYDTEYVKNLSFWQDIKICYKTVLVLARDFIRKF